MLLKFFPKILDENLAWIALEILPWIFLRIPSEFSSKNFLDIPPSTWITFHRHTLEFLHLFFQKLLRSFSREIIYEFLQKFFQWFVPELRKSEFLLISSRDSYEHLFGVLLKLLKKSAGLEFDRTLQQRQTQGFVVTKPQHRSQRSR